MARAGTIGSTATEALDQEAIAARIAAARRNWPISPSSYFGIAIP